MEIDRQQQLAVVVAIAQHGNVELLFAHPGLQVFGRVQRHHVGAGLEGVIDALLRGGPGVQLFAVQEDAQVGTLTQQVVDQEIGLAAVFPIVADEQVVPVTPAVQLVAALDHAKCAFHLQGFLRRVFEDLQRFHRQAVVHLVDRRVQQRFHHLCDFIVHAAGGDQWHRQTQGMLLLADHRGDAQENIAHQLGRRSPGVRLLEAQDTLEAKAGLGDRLRDPARHALAHVFAFIFCQRGDGQPALQQGFHHGAADRRIRFPSMDLIIYSVLQNNAQNSWFFRKKAFSIFVESSMFYREAHPLLV